jgi:opacity protein-like surface antigen
MGSFKSFALAGVFAVAASASSLAADLLPPPPMVPLAPPPLLEASGWYLRGDVGVSAYQRGKFSSTDQPPVQFIQQDFGSGAFAGAGVGYQFNSWFVPTSPPSTASPRTSPRSTASTSTRATAFAA